MAHTFYLRGISENNIEETLAFRRANLKGWQYALANPEEVINWIKETITTPFVMKQE